MRNAALSFVVLSLVACSSSNSSSSSSSSGGASDASTIDTSDAGADAVAFDACTVLTQTEAQDVIGYELTPCRKETVTDAVRHVWESPDTAPIAATGSVNVTVEKTGASFATASAACGASGCMTLPGIGDEAKIDLKLTGVWVRKGTAVFLAQCENPGQIQAGDDAIIQDELTKQNKQANTAVRGDGWRNASSCSLAIAKILIAKLP